MLWVNNGSIGECPTWKCWPSRNWCRGRGFCKWNSLLLVKDLWSTKGKAVYWYTSIDLWLLVSKENYYPHPVWPQAGAELHIAAFRPPCPVSTPSIPTVHGDQNQFGRNWVPTSQMDREGEEAFLCTLQFTELWIVFLYLIPNIMSSSNSAVNFVLWNCWIKQFSHNFHSLIVFFVFKLHHLLGHQHKHTGLARECVPPLNRSMLWRCF